MTYTSLAAKSEVYLTLLRISRDKPGALTDTILAEARDAIADGLGVDAEFVQNAFEFVADTQRESYGAQFFRATPRSNDHAKEAK